MYTEICIAVTIAQDEWVSQSYTIEYTLAKIDWLALKSPEAWNHRAYILPSAFLSPV